ncbi:MAG: alpha/beta hydrolase [Bacteroidota bacterium]
MLESPGPTTGVFRHGAFSLFFHRFGHGPQHLLAFHGFGRSGKDFFPLRAQLENTFTCYAFELFHHHPESSYPTGRVDRNTLRTEELLDFFDAFFAAHGIARFSLLGYSMGSKVALVLTQRWPDRVDQLLLMAPDGFKVNRWYYLASHSWLGIRLYRGIIREPRPFFALVRGLNRLGLVRDTVAKFTLAHLQEPAQRQLVYRVWMTFRNIQPNLNDLRDGLLRHQVAVRLVFGRYDPIIPPKLGHGFAGNTALKNNVVVIYAGHNLIAEKHLVPAAAWLLEKG